MTAIAASKMDDIDKDFGEEIAFHSHDNLRLNTATSPINGFDSDSDLDFVTNGNSPGDEPELVNLDLFHCAARDNLKLAVNCAYLTAETLHKQLNHISEQSDMSPVSDSQTSPLTSTPSSASVPDYLSEAISTAKDLVTNLKKALIPSSRLPASSLSEPQTPARPVLSPSSSSGPLVKVVQLTSSYKDPPTHTHSVFSLARSSSAGERQVDSPKVVRSRSSTPDGNVSKYSTLSSGMYETSVVITERDLAQANGE